MIKNMFKSLTVFISIALSGCTSVTLDSVERDTLIHNGDATKFVQLPLGTMHVRDIGAQDGPVVLMIHGAVIGGFAYKNWQQPLVDAGFRLIIPDLLGYGFSDRPNVSYSKEFYAEQIYQLLDALNLQQPINIIGASLGGATVAAFTSSYPERVTSITLMAPVGGGGAPPVNNILLSTFVGDIVFRLFGDATLKSQMNEAFKESPDRQVMDNWMNAQTRYSGFAVGILNTLRNFPDAYDPSGYQEIGEAQIPAIAFWGTNDEVNPFEQSVILKKHVPQLKIIPLEGKGHSITFEASSEIIDSVIEFFQQTEEYSI